MKTLLRYAMLLCFILSACSAEKSPSNTAADLPISAEVIDLAPAEFANKSAQGILVDVRTSGEIAQGQISHSLSMDYSQAGFESQIATLPKDVEIYLYCAVGGRSSKAGDLLIAQGFTKVYNLQGGLAAWTAAGLPITVAEKK